jgi:hypothetical protein
LGGNPPLGPGGVAGAIGLCQVAVVSGGPTGVTAAPPSGADGSTTAATAGPGATRRGRGFAGALRRTAFFAAAFLTALVLATGLLARCTAFGRGFAALRLATLLPRPALLFFIVDPRIMRVVVSTPE